MRDGCPWRWREEEGRSLIYFVTQTSNIHLDTAALSVSGGNSSPIRHRFLRRCVYQWAVALEEGEESGEELPDPPACNAPVPKKASGGEDDEEEEADGGDEDEEGEQVAAAAWSGDDEDLVGNAPKEVCV